MVQIKNPVTIVKQSGGGGTYDRSDPQQVYEHERPADWLKMPDIGANEDNVIYVLFQRPSTDTVDFIFYWYTQPRASSGTATYEFGTTVNGVFQPISSLTETVTFSNTNGIWTEKTIPASAFGDTTSNGMVQLMLKISCQNVNARNSYASLSAYSHVALGIVDAKCKGTQAENLVFQNGNYSIRMYNLRFFSWLGANRATGNNAMRYKFSRCSSLQAVLAIDTSSATNLYQMFYECRNLMAVPEIDMTSATNAGQMFYNCSTLVGAKIKNSDNVTDFSSMFKGCAALETVSLFDTSSGTGFSSMFNGCCSLKKVPQFDFSSGVGLTYVFADCTSLHFGHGFDTSSVTNFNYMFSTYNLLANNDVLDLRGYDFSSATSMQCIFMSGSAQNSGPGTIYLPAANKWPATGIPSAIGFGLFWPKQASATVNYIIEDDTTMIPLAAAATSIFDTDTNAPYLFVYVPDSMLATYQADTNWATLGTRLKALSTLPS